MSQEYQPLHPVSALAHWGTKSAEIDHMTALYDDLVGKDPTRTAQLNELIEWARGEYASDMAYDNTDFSPG